MFDNAFVKGDSIIHRIDPRFKILVVTVFSCVTAVSSRWAALIPALFISIMLVLLSGLSYGKVCTRLAVVNGLILFLWFFLPFSLEGTPLFALGPLTATREGILYAALLTLRSNIILLALISLVSTTPIFTIGRAIGQFRVPNKMVHLFCFTYRYLHVIHLEYQRLVRALKIRGFRPKTGVRTYKTYAYVVGMLLVRSFDRSERIRNAMLCRGFRGRFYDLTEFCLKPLDFVFMSLMLLAVILIALLEWTKIIY
ncbi:MAG: cobalt ECF transporter T component CbiQ [Thermodesulfobacteriota bacterium]|nr:cobalt ECF transporter T component CbiQ [Thermodesulfobacteriota bacterium]